MENGLDRRPETSLIDDRAHLLTLTIPEMVVVLVGGLRVLNVNADPTSLCGLFNRVS